MELINHPLQCNSPISQMFHTLSFDLEDKSYCLAYISSNALSIWIDHKYLFHQQFLFQLSASFFNQNPVYAQLCQKFISQWTPILNIYSIQESHTKFNQKARGDFYKSCTTCHPNSKNRRHQYTGFAFWYRAKFWRNGHGYTWQTLHTNKEKSDRHLLQGISYKRCLSQQPGGQDPQTLHFQPRGDIKHPHFSKTIFML